MNTLRAFYIIVMLGSLLTINNNLSNLLNPAVYVGILGIVSGILFFSKKYKFYYLSVVWIIVQIPYFKSGDFTLDFAQLINAHLALNFGETSIGINAHILLLLFINHVVLSEYLFQRIDFKAYTENSKLSMDDEYSFVPINIKFEKLIGSSDIQIENNKYNKIEFEPLKDERIKKAGITLISEDEKEKINATIRYKLSTKDWE